MTTAPGDDARARPRRSCLLVPGNVPAMLARAARSGADEVVLDLEDGVADGARPAARRAVVDALRTVDWGDATVAVRVNAVETSEALQDVLEVVGGAGDLVDCLVLPKVASGGEVEFVDHLLRMVEDQHGIAEPIGLELGVETAGGLSLVDEIAFASERTEALVVDGTDVAASLGLPLEGAERDGTVAWARRRVLVAARSAGLQAVDGPYARLRDTDGFRAAAARSRDTGFDGTWCVHPSHVEVANAAFLPAQDIYEHAEAVLTAHRRARAEDGAGAVVVDGELIDEAGRKAAEVTAMRGRAAGMEVRR